VAGLLGLIRAYLSRSVSACRNCTAVGANFKHIYFTRYSVATYYFTFDRIFNDCLIANLLESVPVKDFFEVGEYLLKSTMSFFSDSRCSALCI